MAQKIKRGDTELYLSAVPFEVKEVEGQDRVLRFIGSDETPDRDNDIIEVAGWELVNYRKNPVFLWAHDYRFPPIGRAVKVSKEEGLMFDIEFPAEGIFPFADLIYNLYRGKFLRATSVGFIPKKFKPRDDDLVDESLPEWRRGTRYQKQELLELSAVPVPSNPNALEVARSKGYVTDDQAEALTDFMNGKLGCPTKACKAIEGVWKAEVEIKGVVPPDVSTETAPEDTEWSKPTLADFTDKAWDELTDAEKKKIAGHFAWAKANPPETFGDLKLPHHRPGDGKVVWNGVRAAMGALLGARGGVSIPGGDRKETYEHLVKHYKAFDKEPPEFREYTEVELKTMGFESQVKGNVEIYWTDEKRAEELIGKAKDFLKIFGFEAVKFIVDGKEADLMAKLNETDSITFSFDYLEGNKHGLVLARPIELLFEKSGAVLSRKNKDALTRAQELIQSVLDSAEPAEEGEGDKDAGMWASLKQILDDALKAWREKKEAGDQLAPCYVDAYACMLHNMEHIERGELPEDDGAPQGDEIDLEGLNTGQANEIDLDAIEPPNAAGGQELNIEPGTLKALLKEVVKEELDKARGKVS